MRELRALNFNGTSDPRVVVDVGLEDPPARAMTRVEKDCTSCIFDERFDFAFDNVSAGDLARARVRVTVQDDNVFMSDEDIGTWAIDLLEIYHMKPRRSHDRAETRRDPAAAAHEMCVVGARPSSRARASSPVPASLSAESFSE